MTAGRMVFGLSVLFISSFLCIFLDLACMSGIAIFTSAEHVHVLGFIRLYSG